MTIAASAVFSPTAADVNKGTKVVGNNVLLSPSPGSTPKNLLVVFLPGTGYTPGDSGKYLETAAALGFHTIGLAYVNGTSANRTCRKDRSPDCHGEFRREVIYGKDVSSRVKVKESDSIVDRLHAALTAQGFGQFKTDAGGIDWSKVVVTGHSQGAGHAAVLGIDESVARVVMLAGPNDLLKISLPSWIKRSSNTDPSLWYGLTAQRDNSFGTQMKAWHEFGLADVVDAAEVPTGAGGEQRLVTTIQADDERDHESVVVDDFLALEDGEARLVTSWRYLLTGGGASMDAGATVSAAAVATTSTALTTISSATTSNNPMASNTTANPANAGI
ncbi:MAG: hypothetical protein M3N32_05675 [Actinomycetota bacterium]|nr:hypothetical protein [Actinomycetota bacterium]